MLVLAVLFVAPTSASAGCNHLVGSRTDPLVKLEHLDELIRGQSPLDRTDGPSKSPCSGLSCSKSVPMPISSITPVPEGRDRWGTLRLVVDVDNTSVYRRMTGEPAPAPIGHKSSIFHPPRV